MKPLKLLDLFSGIGGFSLGLERSGAFRTVAFCEIDPFCRRVLAKHWPGVPCFEDVRTLSSSALSRVGTIDAICGGFPCTDISEAGLRKGINSERSGLWFEYLRIIREIRPKFVVVENVADLLLRGIGDVLGGLAENGYDGWWSCLRAFDVGSPQIRDRIWIIAYPAGCKEGRSAAGNCHREFETARKKQAAQAGRCAGDLGGENWRAEPGICRVADGVSRNVDRIAALGNAVVPQIPELIGRAIAASVDRR